MVDEREWLLREIIFEEFSGIYGASNQTDECEQYQQCTRVRSADGK